MTIRTFLYLIPCAFYLILQVYSLAIYPLPWFDEIFFASISEQFFTSGELIPSVSATAMNNSEVVLYGPVYFFIQGIFLKTLGLGMWQSRLPNFLFGIFLVYPLFKIISNSLNINKLIFFLLGVTLFLFDPFYNLSLHEGRMDLMAICWFFMAYYFHQSANNQSLSALFLSLSLLTTPRSLVLIVPFLVLILLSNSKQIIFRYLSIFAALILICFTCKYQSYLDLVLHLFSSFDNADNQRSITEFLFFNGYIPVHEKPIIFATLLVYLVCMVSNKYFLVQLPNLVKWAIGTLVIHYVFIFDFGPYSIYVLPSWYILFFYGLLKLKAAHKYLSLSVLIFILLFNVSFFSLKNYYAFSSISSRNEKGASQQLALLIPSKSRIIGDATYFYIIKNLGHKYEIMNFFSSLEKREFKQRTVFKYQYIIVSDIEKERMKDVFSYYAKKSKLQKVGEIKLPIAPKVWLVSDFDKFGFNASVYKVVE